MLEVAAAALLLGAARAFWGAAIVVGITVGAVITHAVIGGSALPALILMALALLVAWSRRPRES